MHRLRILVVRGAPRRRRRRPHARGARRRCVARRAQPPLLLQVAHGVLRLLPERREGRADFRDARCGECVGPTFCHALEVLLQFLAVAQRLLAHRHSGAIGVRPRRIRRRARRHRRLCGVRRRQLRGDVRAVAAPTHHARAVPQLRRVPLLRRHRGARRHGRRVRMGHREWPLARARLRSVLLHGEVGGRRRKVGVAHLECGRDGGIEVAVVLHEELLERRTRRVGEHAHELLELRGVRLRGALRGALVRVGVRRVGAWRVGVRRIALFEGVAQVAQVHRRLGRHGAKGPRT